MEEYQKRYIGQILRTKQGHTHVKVIGFGRKRNHFPFLKVLILASSPQSKFKEGEIVFMNRINLTENKVEKQWLK